MRKNPEAVCLTSGLTLIESAQHRSKGSDKSLATQLPPLKAAALSTPSSQKEQERSVLVMSMGGKDTCQPTKQPRAEPVEPVLAPAVTNSHLESPEPRQEPSGSSKGSICFLQKAITCLKKKAYRRAPCTTLDHPETFPSLLHCFPIPILQNCRRLPLISKYIEKFLDSILKTKLIPFRFIFESVRHHISEEIESKLKLKLSKGLLILLYPAK